MESISIMSIERTSRVNKRRKTKEFTVDTHVVCSPHHTVPPVMFCYSPMIFEWRQEEKVEVDGKSKRKFSVQNSDSSIFNRQNTRKRVKGGNTISESPRTIETTEQKIIDMILLMSELEYNLNEITKKLHNKN
jgi:hypothetical protein